jgi:BirA family biotin operon repressor/biotin-[acetyl-CoA-carboxylase] ligase
MVRSGEAEEGLLIFADFQSRGRGQGDHSWQSRPGENLLMSLLLRPAFLSASDQFLLSILASVGICDYLREKGVHATVKWPNDILTSRGKIAGILIEHLIKGELLDTTILGIGLNINQAQFQ